MRTTTFLLVTLLILVTGVAYAARDRYVYELEVAGKTFKVTLAERFELKLPDFRQLAILRRAPVTWSGRCRLSAPTRPTGSARSPSAVRSMAQAGRSRRA